MKREKVLCAAVLPLVIFLSSCTKSVESVGQSPTLPVTKTGRPPATNVDTGYKQYVILPGKQFAEGTDDLLEEVNLTKLHFSVIFDSSAIYKTDTAYNQYDINKLYGFADNNVFDHHKFSARFGWNWNKGVLTLYGYIYNNGIMSNKSLGAVPLNKAADCTIEVKGNQYLFTLNSVVTVMPRASTTATAIGYKLFPYFGGTENAPHKITIAIKEFK